MIIKQAIDFNDDPREKISGLFVEAYGNDLQFLSKDKNKLIKAFTHMFVPEYFYVVKKRHRLNLWQPE